MLTLTGISRSRGKRIRRAEAAVAVLALAVVAAALICSEGAEAATGGGNGADRGGEKATPRVVGAKLNRSRIFFGAARGVAFRFELAGKRTRKVLVKVVSKRNRKVVRRFPLGMVAPGSRRRVTWDGRTGKRGHAPQGKYAFQVYSEGRRADVGGGSGKLRVGFYMNRFPLLAKHSYGDGFGAGRGHQGQDVFGKCGSRVVAARAGRVQVRARQSAAGYYVVVDGRGTRQDYVYMHMRKRGRPPEGARVHAGQQIGIESDTGRATGCHLHFEIWTRPGWYEGGRPRSPTKALKRWDRWS
jgi:murein DD-endopeptidase MepM/ murein hydrolase activator NlpD